MVRRQRWLVSWLVVVVLASGAGPWITPAAAGVIQPVNSLTIAVNSLTLDLSADGGDISGSVQVVINDDVVDPGARIHLFRYATAGCGGEPVVLVDDFAASANMIESVPVSAGRYGSGTYWFQANSVVIEPPIVSNCVEVTIESQGLSLAMLVQLLIAVLLELFGSLGSS